MSTKVIVELSGDEERLLNSFRKAEAADEKMRANFQKTGVVIESSGRAIADSMIKAANDSSASLTKIMASLRQTGGEGRKLATNLETFMHDFELAGKKSVQSVLTDLERINPILATQAHVMLDEWAEVDKAEKFESTRKQIAELGGEFATLATQIKKSMEIPKDAATEAARLIDELDKLDPSQADALLQALEETERISRDITFDELVSQLSKGTEETKSLAGAIESVLHPSVIDAAGGFDVMKAKILELRPELKNTLDEWQATFSAADKAEKFETTRKQIRELGGYWATVADGIVKATAAEGKMSDEGNRLLAVLEQIDPEAFNQISNAITSANVALENTTFDKMLSGLAGSTKETQSLVNLVGTELKKATLEAEGGIDGMKQKILAMYPELRQAIELWEKANSETDKTEKFTETNKQIEALGGKYAILAKRIREATAVPIGDSGKHAIELIAELEKIDPSKAEAIRRAMQDTKDAVEKTRLNELVSQLSSGTAEARELAKVIGQGITESALQSQGGIEGIAEEIAKLHPEAQAFVDKWRSDMAEAAKYSEGKFESTFNALRAGDKVSKEVADALKAHFVSAGLIVEKTFEDMIAPLEKIDPKLAHQARRLHEHFDGIEKRGKGAFAGISRLATSEIAQIGSAYLGVQEVIQAVTESIREQEEVRRGIANDMKSIAAVESDARKNLRGFSSEQKDQIFGAVPKMMEDTTFDDLKAVYQTIGNIGSAGASSVDEVLKTLSVAMQMNAPTPGQAATFGPSLLDFNRAAGGQITPETSAAIGLEISRLARITDPEKVFRNAGPAMTAGAQVAGPGQMADGAMQGGALFAALTKAGVDPQGDSSQTATIQFIQRLDGFFKGLGDSKAALKARGELEALTSRDGLSAQERVTMDRLLERKKSKDKVSSQIEETKELIDAIDENRRQGLGTAQSKRDQSFQRSALSKELNRLEALSFDDFDEAKLSDLLSKLPGGQEYETKLTRLQKVIASGSVADAERLKTIVTPEAQLRAIQSNPGLQKSFLEEDFGEQRFRPGYRQLIVGGQAFQDFQANTRVLRNARNDPTIFPAMSEELLTGSPSLREATGQRSDNIGRESQVSTDSTAAIGNFRDTFDAVMKDTAFTMEDSFKNRIFTSARLRGTAGPEEIVSGIEVFKSKLDTFREGGLTEEERPKAKRLQDAIDSAKKRLASSDLSQFDADKLEAAERAATAASRDKVIAFAGGGGGGSVRLPVTDENRELFSEIAEILRQQREIQSQMLETNKKTQQNTRPQPPNTSAAQRTAAANANGRNGRP